MSYQFEEKSICKIVWYEMIKCQPKKLADDLLSTTVCIWKLFCVNLGFFLNISILDLLNPSLRFKVDRERERAEHISSGQNWVLSKFSNTKSLKNLNIIYMYI